MTRSVAALRPVVEILHRDGRWLVVVSDAGEPRAWIEDICEDYDSARYVAIGLAIDYDWAIDGVPL